VSQTLPPFAPPAQATHPRTARTSIRCPDSYPLVTALLVGVGLTQIGEFSFILVQVARGAGHVGDDVYNATLAASLLTILINATLVRLAPRWRARGGRQAPTPATAPPVGGSGR
jgi:predicted Kef-type K+ transport protein